MAEVAGVEAAGAGAIEVAGVTVSEESEEGAQPEGKDASRGVEEEAPSGPVKQDSDVAGAADNATSAPLFSVDRQPTSIFDNRE